MPRWQLLPPFSPDRWCCRLACTLSRWRAGGSCARRAVSAGQLGWLAAGWLVASRNVPLLLLLPLLLPPLLPPLLLPLLASAGSR